jgi:hypothetical protein
MFFDSDKNSIDICSKSDPLILLRPESQENPVGENLVGELAAFKRLIGVDPSVIIYS